MHVQSSCFAQNQLFFDAVVVVVVVVVVVIVVEVPYYSTSNANTRSSSF